MSVGSLSGEHVLFGHLRQLAKWTQSEHEIVLLVRESNIESARRFLPYTNVTFEIAPRFTQHWFARSAWEFSILPRMLRKLQIDRYFTPAGTILPRCEIPQISLAQNPWCLTPSMHRTKKEKVKAKIQRAAYATAAKNADLMIYNSMHMRTLYRANIPNECPAPSVIAYQGVHDELYEKASSVRQRNERSELQILTVSVMAHWKGIRYVVEALSQLHQRGVQATLKLVGPWADKSYEHTIRRLIQDLKLQDYVDVTGKVSVDALHDYYASSRVYCLMSSCESFGIPAVESQVFGTPVVGSSNSAMPEVGGSGGVYCSPEDVDAITNALERILCDKGYWNQLSHSALENAARYRWEFCSLPMMEIFNTQLETLGSATAHGVKD